MGSQQHTGGERGAAVLLALIAASVAAAFAATLLIANSIDTLITGSYRAAQESLYALDAGLERSMGELAGIPDWTTVLLEPPGNQVASFDEGLAVVRAPDGRTVHAAASTARLQAASDAAHGPSVFGADRPIWRLYARAPLQSILPAALVAPPAYVLVWVADDGEDGDGDASRDANGQVLLHGEAFGVSGTHRAVEAAIARAAPGVVRLLSWKDVR